MRSLYSNYSLFEDALLRRDEFASLQWGQADTGSGAPSRPSVVEQRGREAGLTHWQVAYGSPNRLADLGWLDDYFTAQGWQVPTYDVGRPGQWPLQVDDCHHVVPVRFLLSLLKAAERDEVRFAFGLQLFLDGEPRPQVLELVAHGHSAHRRHRLTTVIAWAESYQVWLARWAPPVLQWLGRQPASLRWALLHETRPRKGHNGLADLNWTAWQLARQSTRARLRYLSPAALWEHLTGTDPRDLHLPRLDGFKFGTLHALCLEFQVSLARPREASVQGWLQAFVQLVRLFGDYQAVRRFVTQGYPWTLQGLHDAGQYRLPGVTEAWTPSRWAALCLRHPQAVSLAQHFATVEARGHGPQSWSEFRRLQFETTYPGGAQWAPLKLLCGELGLSASEYKVCQGFWETVKPKPADFMPHVALDGDGLGLPGWRLVKLAASDLRGPLLGSLSGCCQHLNGAGQSCARQGVTSPFSAFYVVERNGVVVAQSWVWRNNQDGLVLDSVEAKDRSAPIIQAVAQLWKAAAPRLLGQLGVKALYIGDCSSGITRAVGALLVASEGPSKATLPMDENGYYDGRWHHCWAGKSGARKHAAPVVEGYRPTPATPERPLARMPPEDIEALTYPGRDAAPWVLDEEMPWMRDRRGAYMRWMLERAR